MGRYFS